MEYYTIYGMMCMFLIFYDLEWLSGSRHCSTSNNSKTKLYLQRQTNRKSYMIYQMAPFS